MPATDSLHPEHLHTDLDGGWILPTPVPRDAVHTRSIVCRSFRRDDGMLDIDGRFIDTRAFDYDSEWRGHCAAGSALHHMQLWRIEALVDTCHSYKSGGPLMERLSAQMKTREQTEAQNN